MFRAAVRADTYDIERHVGARDFDAQGGMRERLLAQIDTSLTARTYDLRPFSPPQRHDQGRSGTCAAQAVTRALEIKRIQKYGHSAHIALSRAWLYFAGREAMDPPEVDRDEGTYLSLLGDALTHKGIPAEEHVPGRPVTECWPWSPDLDHLCTEPSWMASRAAYVHKIETWSKIRSKDEDLIEDILINLAVDNPVVLALPIDSSWEGLRPNETLTEPSVSIGPHAVLCVGWDPARGLLLENSWGHRWCDDGFGWIDPLFVARRAFDLLAFQGGWETWAEKKA